MHPLPLSPQQPTSYGQADAYYAAVYDDLEPVASASFENNSDELQPVVLERQRKRHHSPDTRRQFYGSPPLGAQQQQQQQLHRRTAPAVQEEEENLVSVLEHERYMQRRRKPSARNGAPHLQGYQYQQQQQQQQRYLGQRARAEHSRRYGRPTALPPLVRYTAREDSPIIMFGDAGGCDSTSQGTGLSQQELLRRKVRPTSRKKKKRKKKSPIVGELPSSLRSSNTSTRRHGSPRRDRTYQKTGEESMRKPWGLKTGRHTWTAKGGGGGGPNTSDDTPTSESTVESETRNSNLKWAFSAMPIHDAVVNEVETVWLEDQMGDGSGSVRSHNGTVASGSSFPLLSTGAKQGEGAYELAEMVYGDEEGVNRQLYENNQRRIQSSELPPIDHDRGAPPRAQVPQQQQSSMPRETVYNDAPPTENTNRVRFSAKLSKLHAIPSRNGVGSDQALFEESESSQPWDEKGSPISIANGPGSFVHSIRGTPKSILRQQRYSPAPADVSPPQPVSPVRHNHRGAEDYPKSTATARVHSYVVDFDGLAPNTVRNAPPYGNHHQQTRQAAAWGHPAEKSANRPAAAAPQTPRQAGNITYEKTGPGQYYYNDYAHLQAEFPDPPLDIQLDDESTVVSARMAFIEAVAAVVIQTAVRRFLAAARVHHMRQARGYERQSRSLSYEPTQPARETYSPNKAVARHDAYRHDSRTAMNTYAFKQESPHTMDTFRSKGVADVPTRPGPDSALARGSTKPAQVELQEEEKAAAFRMYTLAAIRIQAVFRGFWARDTMDVDHYCATIIQTAFRRCRARNRFFYTMYQIELVQSVWRRNIARDHAAFLLGSVITIQALIRSFLSRRLYQSVRLELAQEAALQGERAAPVHTTEWNMYDEAATGIQSQWRAYVAETQFIRDLVDVLIVQSVARTWLARRRYATLQVEPRSNQKQAAVAKTLGPADRKPASRVMNYFSKDPGTARSPAVAPIPPTSVPPIPHTSLQAAINELDGTAHNRLLVLISTQSLSREQLTVRSKISTILFAHKVPFDEIDGSDKASRARRDELFSISQTRGQYPQFFVVNGEKTVFLCDRHDFFQANEDGELGSLLKTAGLVEGTEAATIDYSPSATLANQAPAPEPSVASPPPVKQTTGVIDTSQPAGRSKNLISMWQDLDRKNNGC